MFEKSETEKSLWEMLEEAKKPGSNATRHSQKLSAVYFWVVTFTTPMIFITQVIPSVFSESSESTRYWMKVLCAFIAVEISANWLCARLSSTHVEGTRDRPEVEKTLWEDHGGANGDITKNSNFCKICKLVAPYGSKSHHCKECKRCILRRDHHCFMLGTCVGYYNQRYFVMLLFYLGISSIMFFYYFRQYLLAVIESREDFSWTEHILPVTFIYALLGRIGFLELWMLFCCYTYAWTSILGCGLFGMQMMIIFFGQTLHEFKSNKPVRTYRKVSENFREVFGPCWLANFIIPTQLVFRQKEFDQPLLLFENDIPTGNGGSHVSVDMSDI